VYSPPRRGEEAAASTKSCEATEAPQTGAKREREAVIVVNSAKSSGLNSFAKLTTRAAPFRNGSIFIYGASTPPLRGGESPARVQFIPLQIRATHTVFDTSRHSTPLVW